MALALVGAGIAGIVLCFLGAWRSVELKTFDALSVHTAPGEVTLPITILAIDEESMGAVDRQWPWPRNLYADLLGRLKEAEVAAVAFDIVFSEPDATRARMRRSRRRSATSGGPS